MASVLESGKKLGSWCLDLCRQRWVQWAVMAWLLYNLWSGSVKATIDAHYWLLLLFAFSVSLFVIGLLLDLFGAVLNRGDVTAIEAIKAYLQGRWKSRPTLGAFLRGPK